MKVFPKLILSFIFFFFFISSPLAKTDYVYLENEMQVPNVRTQNILLYNLNDNKILYEKDSDEKISIASLTKIMTSLVAIEKIENVNEVVMVPSGAFYQVNGYAEAGFKEGEKVTYKDLLYGTLLPSGADAAQALAILTYGSFSSFAKKMNEMASRLGMQNTHYNNPVGRDAIDNYSTLSDLAKLLFYALKNPIFYEIYTTRYYSTLNNLELESTLVLPSKHYNLDISNIKGSKSGFTKEAGLCLSSIAEYDGVKYLLITAGSLYENGFPNHIVDSLAIYNYFFKNYSYQPILNQGKNLFTLPIVDGYEQNYEIKSTEDIYYYLPNQSQLDYNYKGIDSLNSKIKENTKLGEIEIRLNNQILYSYSVFLEKNLKYKYTKLKIGIGILCLFFSFLIGIIIKKQKKK